MKGPCTYSGPFPFPTQSGFGIVSLFKNSDRLVRRYQESLGGTFHRRRSLLLKTGFFRQVSKGAEITKEF